MSSDSVSLSYSDIISIVREDFQRNGYSVSDTCDKFTYLPVDLFCTLTTNNANEYCFILVASMDHISDDFQKKHPYFTASFPGCLRILRSGHHYLLLPVYSKY